MSLLHLRIRRVCSALPAMTNYVSSCLLRLNGDCVPFRVGLMSSAIQHAPAACSRHPRAFNAVSMLSIMLVLCAE